MKKITKALSFLLFLTLLSTTLFGCGGGELAPLTQEKATAEEPTATAEENRELTAEEKKLLDQRRETALAYMNEMANVLWRSTEDVTYTLKSGITPDQDVDGEDGPTRLTIQKGRLYRGLPYTYAGNGTQSFLDYAASTNDKGVAEISGLSWEVLSGGFSSARVGNDCSTALTQSWGQVSSSVEVTNTAYMCADKGYLPVGDYLVSEETLTATIDDCMRNTAQKMYQCYAQLQKADGVVHRNDGSGHAMMITDVHVEYTKTGIHGGNSYVTVTHQTRGKYSRDAKFFSDEHGEDVYYWYGIGDTYSFATLFEQGYLPITCKEFIDPAPIPETTLTDSEAVLSADNILAGTISTNRMMDQVSAVVTAEDGTVVQKSVIGTTRKEKHSFECSVLASQHAVGNLAPDALPAGKYRLEITVRFPGGQTMTARDFTFTK